MRAVLQQPTQRVARLRRALCQAGRRLAVALQQSQLAQGQRRGCLLALPLAPAAEDSLQGSQVVCSAHQWRCEEPLLEALSPLQALGVAAAQLQHCLDQEVLGSPAARLAVAAPNCLQGRIESFQSRRAK